jgi:hypothetical protein
VIKYDNRDKPKLAFKIKLDCKEFYDFDIIKRLPEENK